MTSQHLQYTGTFFNLDDSPVFDDGRKYEVDFGGTLDATKFTEYRGCKEIPVIVLVLSDQNGEVITAMTHYPHSGTYPEFILDERGFVPIVQPEDDPDPVRRVLRQCDLPVTILERVKKIGRLYERYYDNAHCPMGGLEFTWETDGKKTVLETTVRHSGNSHSYGSGSISYKVSDATFAVCRDDRHTITDVIVCPECKPELLLEALS